MWLYVVVNVNWLDFPDAGICIDLWGGKGMSLLHHNFLVLFFFTNLFLLLEGCSVCNNCRHRGTEQNCQGEKFYLTKHLKLM